MAAELDPTSPKVLSEAPKSADRRQAMIGTALVESRLLTSEQLQQALKVQAQTKQRLGEAAVSLGFVSDVEFAKFLAKYFEIPFVELSREGEIDMADAALVPETLARRYSLVATRKEGNTVTIAMADPLDVRAVDAVRLETRCRVRKTVASASAVQSAIERCYHAPDRLEASLDKLLDVEKDAPSGPAKFTETEDNALGIEQLKLQASDAPVVQFVNLTLMRAVQERASDIHIEPELHGDADERDVDN